MVRPDDRGGPGARCRRRLGGPAHRHSSAFGNRFDGEVDAFLILVLSVYVAPRFGAWVLAAGLDALRVRRGRMGDALDACRGSTYRYWRKVVTATQGIVLTFAAADVLPRLADDRPLVVGLALLAESFGRDVAGCGASGLQRGAQERRHRCDRCDAAAATDRKGVAVPTRARIEPRMMPRTDLPLRGSAAATACSGRPGQRPGPRRRVVCARGPGPTRPAHAHGLGFVSYLTTTMQREGPR